MSRKGVLGFGVAFLILFLACIVSPSDAKVNLGDLDSTFGTGGKVTTYFGVGDGANALAIDSDGKIVVSGVANYTNTGNAFILI